MLQRFVLATRKQETQSERPKKYDIWLFIKRKHYDWQEALLSQRKTRNASHKLLRLGPRDILTCWEFCSAAQMRS